ncbi:MAG: hydrolase [Patescibacteria group bacterium]|nr:hydrolase [Patescibacteria group bacterium]
MSKSLHSKLITREGAALIVIDVQEKLLPKIAEKEKLVDNIVKLIKFAKIINIPIILTEQYPKGLGHTIKEINEILPDLHPIEKTTFSCFGSEEFKEQLSKMRISTLIITGVETHVCVSQTVLEGVDKFKVCVISDAVSSRTKENWHIGLERMRENRAIISSTEMIMYELLGDAKTKEFKESLDLLK